MCVPSFPGSGWGVLSITPVQSRPRFSGLVHLAKITLIERKFLSSFCYMRAVSNLHFPFEILGFDIGRQVNKTIHPVSSNRA